VRDLRYRFPEIESRLRDGKEIEITKRRKVIARWCQLQSPHLHRAAPTSSPD
jgi:antitoxin (DNA-binding transcriptional repressor) of toxin-antitoxin stability system